MLKKACKINDCPATRLDVGSLSPKGVDQNMRSSLQQRTAAASLAIDDAMLKQKMRTSFQQRQAAASLVIDDDDILKKSGPNVYPNGAQPPLGAASLEMDDDLLKNARDAPANAMVPHPPQSEPGAHRMCPSGSTMAADIADKRDIRIGASIRSSTTSDVSSRQYESIPAFLVLEAREESTHRDLSSHMSVVRGDSMCASMHSLSTYYSEALPPSAVEKVPDNECPCQRISKRNLFAMAAIVLLLLVIVGLALGLSGIRPSGGNEASNDVAADVSADIISTPVPVEATSAASTIEKIRAEGVLRCAYRVIPGSTPDNATGKSSAFDASLVRTRFRPSEGKTYHRSCSPFTLLFVAILL